MNRNINSNIPRNDNNLDTLPRTTELMQTFKQNYKNVKDCIIRYIEHNHYQVITNRLIFR